MRATRRAVQGEREAFPMPERRSRDRTSGGGEPDRRYLVSMILGTYREMPGLSLHLNQAARLFGLRTPTCRIVLDDLVTSRHLRRTSDGQYISQ